MAQSFAQRIKLLVNFMFCLYSILDKIKYFNLKTRHISTSNICCWGFCTCVVPFYSLFHQCIYLLDILATGTRWGLWWKWTWSGHVSSMRSHLCLIRVDLFWYHAGYCKKVAWIKTDYSSFISIQRFVLVHCTCYFHDVIDIMICVCIVLRCCTWSLARFQERTERCVIYLLLFGVFSNQIRKGPSCLMSLFLLQSNMALKFQ